LQNIEKLQPELLCDFNALLSARDLRQQADSRRFATLCWVGFVSVRRPL